MTKFPTVYTALLVFLAASVTALPQDRLAPAVNLTAPTGAVPVHATAHPRQVHNADYGSNGGPTGNPQPAQQTSSADDSSNKDSNDDSSSADDSSDVQKRRVFFVPDPSSDVDYSVS